jgi:hypothetical protein
VKILGKERERVVGVGNNSVDDDAKVHSTNNKRKRYCTCIGQKADEQRMPTAAHDLNGVNVGEVWRRMVWLPTRVRSCLEAAS